jgi:hypothetical protein
LISGNRGGLGNWNGEGMGREWGGGGQFTSNLGPGWTRIAPNKEEGFQVSRRDSGKGKLSREISKGNWQGEWKGDSQGVAPRPRSSSVYMYHDIV